MSAHGIRNNPEQPGTFRSTLLTESIFLKMKSEKNAVASTALNSCLLEISRGSNDVNDECGDLSPWL